VSKLIQLLFPTTVKVKCPVCSSDLALSELRFGNMEPFPCPACKELLCIAPHGKGSFNMALCRWQSESQACCGFF